MAKSLKGLKKLVGGLSNSDKSELAKSMKDSSVVKMAGGGAMPKSGVVKMMGGGKAGVKKMRMGGKAGVKKLGRGGKLKK
jgi:hypothetical protein